MTNRTVPSAANDRPVSAVLHDIVGNLQEIVRSEVRLAKVELREEAVRAKSSGLILGVGAVIGLYAGGFLLLGIAFALTLVLPVWGAMLLVGGVLGITAAILLSAGRERLKRLHPVAERTIETIKEDVAWMKQQAK